MPIEFGPIKRIHTLRTRGFYFARAGEVLDNLNMTFEERSQDYGERRYKTIGHLDGRLVVVIWTERGVNVRIVSMRKQMDTKELGLQEYWDPDDASEFTEEDFKRGVWHIGNRVLTLEEARAEWQRILEQRRKADEARR